MDSSKPFDVVIIGSGPAGLAAGCRAVENGLSHLVLERSRFANTIQRYRRGKHVMAEPESTPLHPALRLAFEAGSREKVLERWQQDTEAAGVQLACGPEFEVVRIAGGKGAFQLHLEGGEVLRAGHVVLAIGTGGDHRRFEVEGDALPHVAYEIDDASTHVDQRIVVVGAGDSAIEDAIALAEHDNEVTMLVRRDGFDRAKPGNRSAIQQAIAAGEIQVHFRTTVDHFEPFSVVINTPEGQDRIDCDLVVGRLGTLPPRGFLESLGIQFDSSDQEALPRVSETLESSVPGLYLIGDLIGRPLIKHCMNQGFEVIEHILGRPVRSADEPALCRVLEPVGTNPDAILARVRRTIPLFSELLHRQLEALLLESRIHVLRRGDVVYHSGDFGETFFTILAGSVEILTDLPASHAEVEANFSQSTLSQGSFFGEDGLISGRGRAETVIASTPCTLIETSRAAMSRVMSSMAEIAATVDRTWAIRRLGSLLPMLSSGDRALLVDQAVQHTFQAGERLFSEGDRADGLHIIRRGSVVILRERDGQSHAVNYVAGGSHLGEVALVRPSMRRTATAAATVPTQTIRIPTDAMRSVADRYPAIYAGFERSWRENLVRDEQLLDAPRSTQLLDFMIARGGKEATDLLVIDESLCIRCDNCEKACAATHGGVSRLDREGGPRFAGAHLPTACQHCENASCMADCPPEALRRHPSGEVYILDTCIGCGNCAEHCPYGVIKMTRMSDARPGSLLLAILFGRERQPRPQSGWLARFGRGRTQDSAHEVAVKCDLCRDVPARVHGADVACAAACPTGALLRAEPQAFIDRLTSRREAGFGREVVVQSRNAGGGSNQSN